MSLRANETCRHPRGHRLAAVEDFHMDPFLRDTRRREHLAHLCHEAIRPAEIYLRLALEAWIGLRLMGHPLTVPAALILESLVSAARGVIFFVPLNAGVQEGAYVLIGSLLGLPAGLALALSLLKRARDLIKGVPALLVWQFIEGKELRRPADTLVSQRAP